VAEFREVLRVTKVTPNTRRNLLRILHSTRGLDTCLKTFLDHYNIRNGAYSIGQYLHNLHTHVNPSIAQIPQNTKDRYQKSIGDIRNQFMHSAGKIANNESEVNNLISEMESCVATILNLE
jgi:hypothetical protein